MKKILTNKITSKPSRIIALSIIFICVIAVVIYCLNQTNFKLCNISHIADLAVIFATIIATFSLIWFVKDYIARNKYMRIEKAIELTQFYKNHLLHELCYIGDVLRQTNFCKTINTISYAEMENFDDDELQELRNKYSIPEPKDVINSIPLSTFKSILNPAIPPFIDSSNKTNEKIETTYYRYQLSLLIMTILNDLEYFSMSFNTNIADSSIVFPSLHQTFLKNVKLLYVWIARHNKKESDKYYQHIITLFNNWSKIDEENKTIEINAKRVLSKKQNPNKAKF